MAVQRYGCLWSDGVIILSVLSLFSKKKNKLVLIKLLKGYFTQKWSFCHYSCSQNMCDFLLWKKWYWKYLCVCLYQRFSIPVLVPPRSAYFVCYSYRFRCLFYSNASALRSGHHRIFLHDSSSKRTYIFHSKCIEVCETWIKIVYIYRGIWCHTRPWVKTSRSANPWMNVPK